MRLRSAILSLLISTCFLGSSLIAHNQTPTVSSILNGKQLPFSVAIEQAGFALPNGNHSGAFGVYEGKWVLIAGRTNGLHGFELSNNFPPQEQNTAIYVVDPAAKKVFSKSLKGNHSGLTQKQIDELSVTSPQFYQHNKTLYIAGGYGVNTAHGTFTTKDTLTALDLDGVINWVVSPFEHETLAEHIRQVHNPIFQITGGEMQRVNNRLWLIFFGQNFKGPYIPGSSGIYSKQVRRFSLSDNGKRLKVKVKEPSSTNPSFRRRDLNVIPVVRSILGLPVQAFVALSGVFTRSGGIWTVPINITYEGHPTMEDPSEATTFKQGMNNYVCPVLGFYSEELKNMYAILFGGLSFGFFEKGEFETDPYIPFINQVSTIEIDRHGNYSQYFMHARFPTILSTQSNPGNPLLFGAGAYFIPADGLPQYPNGVFRYDDFKESRFLIGYIVGGIQSSLPNTTSTSDSAASSYIFRVYLKASHPEED